MISLNGIFPPLPTTFTQNGAFLPEKMQSNISTLNRFPLAGYLVLGSNGELVMLSEQEKIKTYHVARESIPKDKLMLAGTGGQSTHETIRLTQEAARAGADAALVLHPFYYKGLMDKEALVAHFHAVAESSEIPVLIYNMPANSGMDMGADIILEIARHPNIIGLKDSGGNLVKMGQVIGESAADFQVVAGSAGFLLPALSLGAVGGILALANIAPEECIHIYKYFQQGDLEKARQIQHKIIPPNTAVTRQWGVPALKAAMDHLGLYGGPARQPIQPMKHETKNKLFDILQHAGIQPIKP